MWQEDRKSMVSSRKKGPPVWYIPMNRNSEVLKSFVEYCEANPDLRFWQALRNWSDYNFIYASNRLYPPLLGMPDTNDPIIDTFYWEGRSPSEPRK
jgi:hypothetical protein